MSFSYNFLQPWETHRQSSEFSLSPTKSLLVQPQLHSTPPKKIENLENNSSSSSLNFNSAEIFPEPPTFNTQFEQLKTDSRTEENRVNARRFDRSKLPVLEQVSKPEKRGSSNELGVNPRKKLHETKNESNSNSYLKQAGELLSGFLGNNPK